MTVRFGGLKKSCVGKCLINHQQLCATEYGHIRIMSGRFNPDPGRRGRGWSHTLTQRLTMPSGVVVIAPPTVVSRELT